MSESNTPRNSRDVSRNSDLRRTMTIFPKRNDEDFMESLKELESLKHELRIMKSVYNSRFDNDIGATRAL